MENERTPNFSKYEINVLLELVGANASIIENKKTDGCSLNEKLDTWSRIATQFNSIPGVSVRSSGRLQTCYENLKWRLRKDLTEEKVNLYKTGGGNPTPKKPHDAKLLETVDSSVAPLSNSFDSDGAYNLVVDMDVSVIESTQVECSDYVEMHSSLACAPLENITLASNYSGPAVEEPVPSKSRSCPNQPPEVSHDTGESTKTFSTASNGYRRRMSTKLRASGSVVECVCRKRVDVLEDLHKMMLEHKHELKVKRLKILLLREKLKYWRNKNKQSDV